MQCPLEAVTLIELELMEWIRSACVPWIVTRAGGG